MAEFAGALGQSSQHRVTMRNGFIARQLDATVHALRRTYGLFFHGEILTRGPLSPLSDRPVFKDAIAAKGVKLAALCLRIIE
jgi:hypothetical protein